MPRNYWRLLKVQTKRLLNLRGDRRVIARGIAVGVAMNFVPTVGLGVPVVYWLAGLARGHKMAAVVSTMSIKAIFPILYIFNYIIGEILLERHFVYTLDWHVAAVAGASFFLGSAINTIIAFILTYYWSLYLLTKRQNALRRRCRL